jgi:hypothetical protein
MIVYDKMVYSAYVTENGICLLASIVSFLETTF